MSKALILEQHIHGAYGIDFNTCSTNDFLFVADKLYEHGIGAFFPTLVTDTLENIKKQIQVIKKAAEQNHRILGIHLEGIFLNSVKKGIHNPEHFLELTPDNYHKIEDDFIKIVTLAPELDKGLIEYLKFKGVKVQAGHCTGWGNVDGVTHTFNGMEGINHRQKSTALMALIDDKIHTEIIADGIHVSDDALKLLFKTKPINRIILISDALPITGSNMKETIFADSKIYYDGIKATSENGTIAGSTILLDKIIERLKTLNLYSDDLIETPWKYHGLNPNDFK